MAERRVVLLHRSGLREILGLIEGELTEHEDELEYSDDGETLKRAVLVEASPRRILYREAGTDEAIGGTSTS